MPTNKQEEVIEVLNMLVKVRVAPSKVHGVGVFAIRDIAKGQRLYADLTPQAFKVPYGSMSKLFPEVKELLLERWPNIVNGSMFFWPDCRIQAFLNHSDDPNYGGITDVVLRDVKAGEELFEDYRKILNYEKVYPWLADKSIVSFTSENKV